MGSDCIGSLLIFLLCSFLNQLFPMVLVSKVAYIIHKMPGLINQNLLLCVNFHELSFTMIFCTYLSLIDRISHCIL